MMEPYPNPPVVEAICEFRFDPSSPWDQTIPGLVYDRLRNQFPKRRQGSAITAGIAKDPEGLRHQLVLADRLQLLAEDENLFLQIGPHFLAIHCVRSYSTWETFLPTIQKALNTYREVAQPKAFERVGLRYVNHILFPEQRVELEEYFEYYPFVGTTLPQDFGRFLVSVEYYFENERDILRLQLASGASEQPDVPLIVLDLDYFLGRPGTVSLDDAEAWLHKAHSRISTTFEGCLKDRLRKVFRKEGV